MPKVVQFGSRSCEAAWITPARTTPHNRSRNGLFEPGPIESKKITAEVCIHHLYFNSDAYQTKGTDIKCNPAVKSRDDQLALQSALKDDRIDVIATDHAPHTRQEKQLPFLDAPRGVPLVEFALPCLLSS